MTPMQNVYKYNIMNIYSIPKKQRHRRLLALLGREQMHTQEHLRRRLAAKGIRVTQATLSRDIKELGLARTPDGYKVVAAAEPVLPPPPLAHLVQEFVREITKAGQLLVLKTIPGSAQPVAASLDEQKWKDIAGTIAGDDTILVITANRKMSRQVKNRLAEMIKA